MISSRAKGNRDESVAYIFNLIQILDYSTLSRMSIPHLLNLSKTLAMLYSHSLKTSKHRRPMGTILLI